MAKAAKVALVLVAALAILYLADRVFNTDKALAQAKCDYAALKAATDADADAAHAALVAASATIATQDAIIADSRSSVALKNAEIAELRRQLTTIVDEEPIQPELESEPLVINLRKQIKWTSDMLALSQGIVSDQANEIKALEVKFDQQARISDQWRRLYENERALRIAAEDMFSLSERHNKSAKTWRTIAITAGAVAAGIIIAK